MTYNCETSKKISILYVYFVQKWKKKKNKLFDSFWPKFKFNLLKFRFYYNF